MWLARYLCLSSMKIISYYFYMKKSAIVFEYFCIVLSRDWRMNFQKGKDITIYFLPIFNLLIYTCQIRKIFAVGSNYFYTGKLTSSSTTSYALFLNRKASGNETPWLSLGSYNSQLSSAFNVLTPMIFFTYNRFLAGLQTWKLWY